MTGRQKYSHQFSLEHSGVRGKREGSSVVFVGSLENGVSSARAGMCSGSIGINVKLTGLMELGRAREAITNDFVHLRWINSTGIVCDGGDIKLTK